MGEKKLADLETFVSSVNKKDEKRNGRKIKFSWSKRKKKR